MVSPFLPRRLSRRSRRLGGCICFLFILLSIHSAFSQEIRNVTVGWGDAVRLGRWTPVFVTVEDPQVREIDLQIHGTYGEKNEALWLHQTAVAQPTPTIYSLLYPFNAQPSRIVVIVSDKQTGRTLDSRAIQNNSSIQMPMRLLGPNEILIGLSGNIDDFLALKAQLQRAGISAGVLDPLRLPANFAGYDGISLLILAAPDLDQLKYDQEQAILQWIARGGNLLLIPPTTLIPQSDPLIAALPATIGANQTVQLTNGPTTRPITFNARELLPRPDASALTVLDDTGYFRPLGLGKIAVIPVDISPMDLTDPNSTGEFWRSLLQPIIKIPAPPPTTSMIVSDVDASLVPGPNVAQSVGRGQRESDAILHVLQMMGAATPSLEIHWRRTLLTLACFCFLLGPVDSILLMRLGQRPRTWLTFLGWVGLILSLAGIATAHKVKPTETAATFRLLDQVNDQCVAATDIISLNANHAATLPLSLDKMEWWEPANQAARFFNPNRFADVTCHQDRTGTRPEWVNLNGAQPQSWHGEMADVGPGLLLAKLQIQPGNSPQLIGSLTNRSKFTMQDIQIITAAGNVQVPSPLVAGGTLPIDLPIAAAVISPPNLPADITNMSPDRTDCIDELIQSGSAEILCQMPSASDVKIGRPITQHWQLLRAILPISR